MLVTENILYILPYCQTMEERANKFEAENNTPYVYNTMDGACSDEIRQFHEMIYYTVVTSTTAGYGDISP